jgi:predicted flap endonuclease-1-like 5' DNA nuclease
MDLELTLSLPIIGIAVLVLALVVWAVLRANRRAKVIDAEESLKRDVLDEGAARARRNQALIDAAPAAPKEPAPTPAPAPQPAPVPAPAVTPAPAPMPASADDLTRIKGLGPKIAALLGELGVTSFAQIANWSDADIADIDAKLGRFSGRITRDQWVAQAKLLAAGDDAGFAAQFGRNGAE